MWLAVTLRARKKCKIQPPEWLSKESLEEKLREEKETPFFTSMPAHFQEIAALLFECASTDIPEAEVRLMMRHSRMMSHTD